MNYSQKTQNKAQDIQYLSDAFEEVRDRLSVLTVLDLSGIDNHLGSSIQYIVHEAIDMINAIECKIDAPKS